MALLPLSEYKNLSNAEFIDLLDNDLTIEEIEGSTDGQPIA